MTVGNVPASQCPDGRFEQLARGAQLGAGGQRLLLRTGLPSTFSLWTQGSPVRADHHGRCSPNFVPSPTRVFSPSFSPEERSTLGCSKAPRGGHPNSQPSNKRTLPPRGRDGGHGGHSWGLCKAEQGGRRRWGLHRGSVPGLRTTGRPATGLVISLADLPAPGPKGELDTSHPMLSIV